MYLLFQRYLLLIVFSMTSLLSLVAPAAITITESGRYTVKVLGETSSSSPQSFYNYVTIKVPDGDRVSVSWADRGVDGSNFRYAKVGCDISEGRTYDYSNDKTLRFYVSFASKNGFGATYEWEARLSVTYYRKTNLKMDKVSVSQNGKSSGDDLTDDEDVLVDASWKNDANADTKACYAGIYVDNKLVKEYNVDELDKGDTDSFRKVNIGKLSAGEHVVKVLIDSRDTIDEYSESDNAKSITVNIVEGVPTLNVDENNVQLPATASRKTLSVKGNVAWTARTENSWITLEKQSGDGRDSVGYEVSRNTSSSSRSGSIVFSGEEGVSKVVVLIRQEGMTAPEEPVVTVSNATSNNYVILSWPAAERALTYEIQRKASNADSWILMRELAAVSFLDDTVIPGVVYHYRVVAKNEAGRSFSEEAEGMRPHLFEITCDSISDKAAAFNGVFSIACNREWKVSCDQSWVLMNPSFGFGEETVEYIVSENYTTETRVATISVVSGELEKIIVITQAGQIVLNKNSGCIQINTGDDIPKITFEDGVFYSGIVSNGLAVFEFDYVEVGPNVSLTVTGTRPLIIYSKTNVKFLTGLDISGAEAGRCGGGIGGIGGVGGPSVAGALGGVGGKGGEGWYWSPWIGGDNVVYHWDLDVIYAHYVRLPRIASPGKVGANGEIGALGAVGEAGKDADLAYGQIVAVAKGGLSGGVVIGTNEVNGGKMGWSSIYLNDSNQCLDGRDGISGGDGIDGTGGIDAHCAEKGEHGRNSLDALLLDLALIGGSAGGGGGGGASGSSGSGGGGGGGGSSGVPVCNDMHFESCCQIPEEYVIGNSGKGGSGGAGGRGGDSGAGGQGGNGGNGGGAILIQARGTIEIGGEWNVSSYNLSCISASGEKGMPGESGLLGENGDLGSAVDTYWGSRRVGPTRPGGAGGTGGKGGAGGKGGNGGRGGDGGYGAPGMVKLCGSLILAQNGTIVADNGNGDTDDNRCGAVIFISNMTDAQRAEGEPTYEHKVLTGSCRYDEVLMVPSVYDSSVKVPVLGQLKVVRAAASGICLSDNYVLQKASIVGVESTAYGLQLKRVSGIYDGYDQIFLINSSSAKVGPVKVKINGVDCSIPELQSGEVWTTCVPTGVSVVVVGKIEESLTVSSSSISAEASGVNGTISVTANCDWSVSISDSWITVSPKSGSGNGTISYTIAANTAAQSRPGTITVTSSGGISRTIAVSHEGLAMYEVTFNPNGGTLSGDATRNVVSGAVIGALPTPTRDGYTFLGWFTGAEGGTRVTESTVVTGNMTLYAHWDEEGSGDGGEEYTPASLFEYGVQDGGIVIKKYIGKDTVVNIPPFIDGAPVVSIGDNAFFECWDLTSVTIPDSVTSIGEEAFYNCSGLMSVTIPNSVMSIGDRAFYWCSGFTSVTIPNSVTSIGEEAFSGCDKLVEVINKSSLSISKGSSSYGYVAYYALDVHSGESKIVNYNDYLFYTSEGVNYLLGYVGTATALTLPDNYKGGNYKIYNFAFEYCSGLTSVTIPNSVTSIGEEAFYNCSALMSVTIPNSVTSIGHWAFHSCDKLVEVINKSSLSISKGSSSYGYVAYYALDVHSGESKIVNYNDYLFYTSEGVNYLLGYVGTATALTLPDNYKVGNYKIYNFAFRYCSGLTSVTIPNSVTSIGYDAFWGCSGLTSVTIPNSVTSIGFSAFSGCSGLTSITIPNSVTSIEYGAFWNCSNLKSAIFLGDAPRNVGDYIFDDCANDFTIKVKKGTKGWNGDYTSTALPATWHGYPIAYATESELNLTYKVAFNANGGSGSMAAQTIACNTWAKLRANAFKRTGYTFQGWAKSKTGTVAYKDGVSVKNLASSGTVTLYAIWKPNTYNVVFNANGGSGSMAAQTIACNTWTKLRANAFKRTGYTFQGWAKSKTGAVAYKNGASVKNLASSGTVTLFAVWKPNTYNVAFNANGGKGTMSANSMTYGKTAKLRANAFKRSGYVFIGWAKSKTGAVAYKNAASVKNLRSSGTITLYAVWAKKNYKVAFYANGGKGNMSAQTFTYGKAAKLKKNAFKRSGYTFIGWAKSASLAKNGTVSYKNTQAINNLTTKGSTIKLYAVWAKKNYKVAFYANGGKGKMSAQTFTYGKATKLKKNAFKRSGYTFIGWAKSSSLAKKGTVSYKNTQAIKNLVKNGKTVKLYAVWKRK